MHQEIQRRRLGSADGELRLVGAVAEDVIIDDQALAASGEERGRVTLETRVTVLATGAAIGTWLTTLALIYENPACKAQNAKKK